MKWELTLLSLSGGENEEEWKGGDSVNWCCWKLSLKHYMKNLKKLLKPLFVMSLQFITAPQWYTLFWHRNCFISNASSHASQHPGNNRSNTGYKSSLQRKKKSYKISNFLKSEWVTLACGVNKLEYQRCVGWINCIASKENKELSQ